MKAKAARKASWRRRLELGRVEEMIQGENEREIKRQYRFILL